MLMNLSVALILMMVSFQFAGQQYALRSEIACISLATALHYFVLVALMWMAVDAVVQYMIVVDVLRHMNMTHFAVKTALPAWGE